MKENLEWTSTKKTHLFSTRIMEIYNQASISPEGNESNFVVVQAPDWVITVPILEAKYANEKYSINEDCFLMVSQWRHGSEEISIEFPGGVIEKGEVIEEAAKRELLEETGFYANTITHLSSLNPNPAIFQNTLHIFAATDLKNTFKQNLDTDEYVGFRPVPIREVITNMGKKPYCHALMATALMVYMGTLHNKE